MHNIENETKKLLIFLNSIHINQIKQLKNRFQGDFVVDL